MIRRHQGESLQTERSPDDDQGSFLSRRHGVGGHLQAAAAAAKAMPALPNVDLSTQPSVDDAPSSGASAEVATQAADDHESPNTTPIVPMPTPDDIAHDVEPQLGLTPSIPRSGVILAPIASGKTTLAAAAEDVFDVDDARTPESLTPQKQAALNASLTQLALADMWDAHNSVWHQLIKTWAKDLPSDAILLIHSPADAVVTGRTIIGALIPDQGELESRYATKTGPGWDTDPARMRDIARGNADVVRAYATEMGLPVFAEGSEILTARTPIPSPPSSQQD